VLETLLTSIRQVGNTISYISIRQVKLLAFISMGLTFGEVRLDYKKVIDHRWRPFLHTVSEFQFNCACFQRRNELKTLVLLTT